MSLHVSGIVSWVVSGIVSGVGPSDDPQVVHKCPGQVGTGGSSKRADLRGNEGVQWR